jgi:hypothetical protein
MKIGFLIAALIGCLLIVGFAFAMVPPHHTAAKAYPCPNDPTPGINASPQMICFTPSKALPELRGN